MTKNMKIHCVALDGIDKAGKSTLVKYLAQLSNFTLTILDRGPLTNIVWNKIKNRDINYDMEMWKNCIFVRLSVDKHDWEIRCRIHNEPPMPLSYEEMNKAYDVEFETFKNRGFHVLEFNTTEMTQYKIAEKIIEYLNSINKE